MSTGVNNPPKMMIVMTHAKPFPSQSPHVLDYLVSSIRGG